MFHVKHRYDGVMPNPERPSDKEIAALEGVVDWLGVEWGETQSTQLHHFASWLSTEGVTIGGIGPGESDRIWDRHVLDSLVFAKDAGSGGRLLDVGSGVGLPGIPLAIALPTWQVVLVERAGRRVDALERLRRVLGLDYQVLQADVRRHDALYDRIVMRAALTVDVAVTVSPRLLDTGGQMWFGLGRGDDSEALRRWQNDPPVCPPHHVVSLVSTPPGVLDSPAWMLRMSAP